MDSVIGARALQHQEESKESNGEQGERRSFLRCLQRFLLTLRVGDATTNVLSDDDLREIFYHCCHVNNVTWQCLWDTNWWKPLVHVCRRWRRIVFASPNYLNLQLLCDNTTPARDSLDVWPPLPIVLSHQRHYPDNEQDLIAALEHPDRIIKILFPAKSDFLLHHLSAFMQEPLPALTELELQGQHQLVLPEAFLGGSAPCLRSCSLARIGFPGLPKLLASTSQLARLSLYTIPYSGYIPPDAMGSCLATLPNLDRLIINFDFSFSMSHHRFASPPPPPARDILPSLTHFEFTGSAEYLEVLVARFDVPCLYHFVVTFSEDLNFIPSQLVRFVSRSERIKELLRNDRGAELDPWSVLMTDELGGRLELQTSFSILSFRLGPLEQLCDNLSPFLSQVERLRIRGDPKRQFHSVADVDPRQWLNVLRPFSAVHYLSISKGMASFIIGALGGLDRDEHEGVLPELDCMDFRSLDPRDKEVLDNFISDRRSYADHKIVVMERL